MKKKPMATKHKHPIDNRPVKDNDRTLLILSLLLFAGTVPILAGWV